MSNDECRKNDEARMTNRKRKHSSLGFRHSLRHSRFVIRHFSMERTAPLLGLAILFRRPLLIFVNRRLLLTAVSLDGDFEMLSPAGRRIGAEEICLGVHDAPSLTARRTCTVTSAQLLPPPQRAFT